MGGAAVVQGDKITGTCQIHQKPSPSGSPVPAGPMGFGAPLTVGLTVTVQIDGKPVAVVGSNGLNTPPHVGLHPSDPFMAPPTQIGSVVVGSNAVLLENKPAAYTGCSVTMCANVPAQVTGSATTVVIGS